MNAAGFYITDNDPDNEQWMSGGQAGFNVKPSEKVGLTVGAGYFDYHRIEGHARHLQRGASSTATAVKTGTKVVP